MAKQLGFLPGVFDLSAYDEATARRHRKIILDDLGSFDEHAKLHLIKEIRTMVRSQVRPKVILLHGLDILAFRKTEIPTAYTLTNLIINEISKQMLTQVINAQVSKELRGLLEA